MSVFCLEEICVNQDLSFSFTKLKYNAGTIKNVRNDERIRPKTIVLPRARQVSFERVMGIIPKIYFLDTDLDLRRFVIIQDNSTFERIKSFILPASSRAVLASSVEISSLISIGYRASM